MKVYIDTNIIIDILEHRDPFFEDSYKIVQLGLQGKLLGLMSAGAVTDVYYIISRSIGNAGKAREKILALTALVHICDTVAVDINTALTLDMVDFEDSVVAAIAKREKVDYILTRIEADFRNSPVPAMNPSQFLKFFA